MKVYLVGGAVRDRLLGLPAREKDYVVVGSAPEELIALGYRPVGKDFPVFIHPETGDEYALARIERKTGKGYTQFECHFAPDVTLEDDLKRRDLTINAMAVDTDGNIIDPYHGREDLENKILRHVSPAFVEDPVRVLRIARFAARYANLGFTIAEETQLLLKNIVRAGEISALVPERVWQEMQKALAESSPQEFIKVLRTSGALKILLPELEQLFGVPASPTWHPEIDTGVHVLMALKIAAAISSDPILRFAVLMHDLGKGLTPMSEWPKHINHEINGVPLVNAIAKRYKIPREYQRLAVLVTKYHLLVHQAFELRAKTLVKLFEETDAFRRPDTFELFLLACEADSRGRLGFENKSFPEREFIWQAFLACRDIVASDFINSDMNGEMIKEKLKQLRIKKVTEFINDYKSKMN